MDDDERPNDGGGRMEDAVIAAEMEMRRESTIVELDEHSDQGREVSVGHAHGVVGRIEPAGRRLTSWSPRS
jgi:hypothetical protein